MLKTLIGKYGLVDNSNKKILELNYDGVKNIHNGDFYVVKQGQNDILVNKNGEEVLSQGYSEIVDILANPENGLIIKSNDKYGVIKTTGETVVPTEYEELKEAKTGILIAKQNGKYGVIDLTKQELVPFKYNSITYNKKADIYIAEDENFNNEILDNTYSVKLSGILIEINEKSGYLELRQDDEYKYYNFKFEEQKESDVYTSRTLFLSKKDGKYGFVDKDGNAVVDYIYDDATKQNSFGFAGIKKDGVWGSIDSKGKVVQEPTYNLDDYLQIDFIGRWHYGKDLNMNYYRLD